MKVHAACLIMIAMLAFTGCSSDGDNGDMADNRDQPLVIRDITIVANDFAYTPEQVNVRRGERIRVRLVNEGSSPHNIEFELPGGDQMFDANIAPGDSRTITFAAPDEAGNYAFYCPVGNHRGRGMEGTLSVRDR